MGKLSEGENNKLNKRVKYVGQAESSLLQQIKKKKIKSHGLDLACLWLKQHYLFNKI
jgi:hypothetical protein